MGGGVRTGKGCGCVVLSRYFTISLNNASYPHHSITLEYSLIEVCVYKLAKVLDRI